jgi:HSP20 family protein
MSVFDGTTHALQEHVNQIAHLLTSVHRPSRQGARPGAAARSHHPTSPPANVYADAATVVITCEVPGIAPQALDVSVVEDTVTIRGTRAQESGATSSDGTPPMTAIARTITLPFAVDSDHAQARLADGALSITLKRATAAKPRSLKVTVT